jgi:hypothetical protein
MSFYEELLTPGDALYARGPSRRDHGEPNSEGSGTAPWGQLVMYADTGTGGELILTNKTEKQLASRLLRSSVRIRAGCCTFLLYSPAGSAAVQERLPYCLPCLRFPPSAARGDRRP